MAVSDILHFVPKTWNKYTYDTEVIVPRGTTEFRDVEVDIKKGIKNVRRVTSLIREQNIYDFGQFLMRGQILVTEHVGTPYYEVRRYVEIPRVFKGLAVKHNLDHRRLDKPQITFKSHLRSVQHGSLIFIVKILTDNPKEREIVPYNFTEYYIEYIAEIEFL